MRLLLLLLLPFFSSFSLTMDTGILVPVPSYCVSRPPFSFSFSATTDSVGNSTRCLLLLRLTDCFLLDPSSLPHLFSQMAIKIKEEEAKKPRTSSGAGAGGQGVNPVGFSGTDASTTNNTTAATTTGGGDAVEAAASKGVEANKSSEQSEGLHDTEERLIGYVGSDVYVVVVVVVVLVIWLSCCCCCCYLMCGMTG